MIFRQVAGAALAVFLFFAIVTAMSRLLVMKELPDYIDNTVSGLSNLFLGAFGK